MRSVGDVGGRGDNAVDPIERWEVQLRKGCLELAILAILGSQRPGRLYGLEILRTLADGSDLVIPEGTLYPLLSRLKAEGWVDAEWEEAEAGHPRKYYTLTASGRRHLVALSRSWAAFAHSIDGLLKPSTKDARKDLGKEPRR